MAALMRFIAIEPAAALLQSFDGLFDADLRAVRAEDHRQAFAGNQEFIVASLYDQATARLHLGCRRLFPRRVKADLQRVTAHAHLLWRGVYFAFIRLRRLEAVHLAAALVAVDERRQLLQYAIGLRQ